MPEGLSTSDVGNEIAAHAAHAGLHGPSQHDRRLAIAEAIVLSAVAIIAAWSGFSAAKWSTESSIKLSQASATHQRSNRAFDQSLTLRVGDATMFNAWFGAYTAGRKRAAAVAARRFRPEYRVAFDAWLATHPFTNAKAPPGPQSMPQYRPAGQAEAVRLDAEAKAGYKEGEHAAAVADDYVRTTVILASVLFLIGISSHFPVRSARIGMVSVGVGLLLFALILILTLPAPELG